MEKRKYLRFECMLPAEVVRDEHYSYLNEKAGVSEFSREGLRLIIDLGNAFSPGSQLDLMLTHPEKKISSMVTAEVVWSKSKLGKMEMGLRITKIDEFARSEFLDASYQQWREKTGGKTPGE